MTVSRRAFLAGLASMFGPFDALGLTSYIEDLGKPLLLPVRNPEIRLHVYEGGLITFGPYDDSDDGPRPTWRQLLEAEGVAVNDPVALGREISSRWLDPDTLDLPVDDVCWPMAHGLTWCPTARAYRFLERLGVGATLRGRGRLGRLIFHEGYNHPDSNDLWVDVANDLSVSLLQARLIELKQPVEIVMEVERLTEACPVSARVGQTDWI